MPKLLSSLKDLRVSQIGTQTTHVERVGEMSRDVVNLHQHSVMLLMRIQMKNTFEYSANDKYLLLFYDQTKRNKAMQQVNVNEYLNSLKGGIYLKL